MGDGEIEAAYLEAKKLLGQQHYSAAMEAYERLAARGDPKCEVIVGWLYHEGLGVVRDDEQAFEWYRRAADTGHAPGAFYCGRLRTAQGRHAEALNWYDQAARSDYAPAVFWLALAHQRGLGIPQDLKKAVELLETAVRLGSIMAKRELGLVLLSGRFGTLATLRGFALLLSLVPSALLELVRHGYSDRLRA